MSRSSAGYLKLAEHYRTVLEKYGDKTRGMDWPRTADNLKRFAVMTRMFESDLAAGKKVKILDFGCGTAHYFQYLKSKGFAKRINYTGWDITSESISIAKRKYPRNSFQTIDVLKTRKALPTFDYVIINGLFTQKRGMTETQMHAFLEKILVRLQPCYRSGLTFNAMSDQVDFKRRGSFHLNLDAAAKLFTAKLTRHFEVRHDYGLYENTFYLFKKERRS